MSTSNPFVRQNRIVRVWLLVVLTLVTVAALMIAAPWSYVFLLAPLAPLRGLGPALLFGLLGLATVLLFGLLRRGRLWLRQLTSIATSLDKQALPDNLGWLFGVALLILLAASTLYTQFNGLLHGFHQPGAVAAGIEAATSVLTSSGRRSQEIYQALLSWKNFTNAQSSALATNAPITILTWALLVDSIALAPAYGLVLGLLIVWSSPIAATQPGLPPFRRWSPTTVLWFLAIAMAADWLENATTLEVFTRLWFTPSLKISWESNLLYAFTIGKWLGLLLVVLYLLGAAWLYARKALPYRQFAKALLAMRVPLLLVTLFGVALLVHEQVPDILRRFADPNVASVSIGVVGLLATCLFALSIWYSSAWMLVARPTYTLKGSARWLRLLISLGVLLCITLAVLDAFNARATGSSWGWKPLLPLLLTLPFWVLTQFPPWLASKWDALWNWLTSKWYARLKIRPPARPVTAPPADHPAPESEQIPLFPETLSQSDFLPQPDWVEAHGPRVLGGAVLVILAIALLRSTAGLIFYNHLRRLPVLPYYVLLGVGFLLLGGVSLAYWAMGRATISKRLSQLAPTQWRTVSLILLGSVLSWGALLVWWLLSPTAVYTIAPKIGAIGLLSVNLLLINFILCAVIAVVNQGSQAQSAMVRLPVLSMLALWFVLAASVPPQETLHNVFHRPKQTKPGQAIAQAQDIETLFDHWRCRNHILPTDNKNKTACPPDLAPQAEQAKAAVPLVLIATAGGGIRAAVWTAYVLDRVLYDADPNPATPRLNRVFAISSVSGGSLGVASYIAQLASTPSPQPDMATIAQPLASFGAGSPPPPPEDPCAKTDDVSDEHWVCTHLSSDAISPALGWLLFVEAPWSLLRFDLGWHLFGWQLEERDRARVLEESWEQTWPRQTRAALTKLGDSSAGLATDLFALNALTDTTDIHVPLLVFNGTTVESGCRMNTSVLTSYKHVAGEPVKSCLDSTNPVPAKRVLGATLDLVDFLCKSDELPLSKAALLSARFPLISPSGRVTQCLTGSPLVTDTLKVTDTLRVTETLETYVVDGGYLENSGADTALELWLALQPLIAKHNKNNALPPIVPFFIQIDNGYAEPAAPGGIPSAPQLLVPVLAFGATLNGHQALARQAAENIFSRQYSVEGRGCFDGNSRYAHFIPQAHPGPEAPLGWTLSQGSFRDLSDQFLNNFNQQAKTQADSWFANVKLSFTACVQ